MDKGCLELFCFQLLLGVNGVGVVRKMAKELW